MLESGVEDEHIQLIEKQMEFGSTVGMMPWLLPLTKLNFLPVPWVQDLQAGRERLKKVSLALVLDKHVTPATNNGTSLPSHASSGEVTRQATGRTFSAVSSKLLTR